MTTIGDNIRRIRREAGLTQEALGRLLKVEKSSISEWESGSRLCHIVRLCQIARMLGCTVDDLLEGTECGDVIRPRT